jgi:hypothetical protein
MAAGRAAPPARVRGDSPKMFCPQCGQQQPAEAVRFCKRCGMALDRLAQFVEGGGQLAAVGEGGARALTPRQRGTRMGLLVMVAGLLFGGIAALLQSMKDDLFVFLPVAAVVFTVGVMRLLYGLLLEEGAPPRPRGELAADDARRPAIEAPTPASLPPARAIPVSAHTAHAPDTKDMAAPRATVTESTTKLLEEE